VVALRPLHTGVCDVQVRHALKVRARFGCVCCRCCRGFGQDACLCISPNTRELIQVTSSMPRRWPALGRMFTSSCMPTCAHTSPCTAGPIQRQFGRRRTGSGTTAASASWMRSSATWAPPPTSCGAWEGWGGVRRLAVATPGASALLAKQCLASMRSHAGAVRWPTPQDAAPSPPCLQERQIPTLFSRSGHLHLHRLWHESRRVALATSQP